MSKKILVISNMYPSKKYPHYGVFVKNSVDIMKSNGFLADTVYMIKTDHKIHKIIRYIVLYIKAIIKGIFGGYDLIYAHYASHTALPILAIRNFINKPIIINVHGNDVVPETKKDEEYFSLVKKAISAASFIICPSIYFENEVLSRFKIAKEKVGVYPSGGVDTHLFIKCDKVEARNYLNINSGCTVIGYVSRIEEHKGWDIFLEACAKICRDNENIQILVVGDGMQINEYNMLVNQLNLKERILKYDLLPQEKLVKIFNALDIFVFPTYRKSESLGLVGLEAMSCETITILPNQYGPSSYGENEVNAFIFKSEDVIDLYRTIEKALNYKNIERIKKAARQTALKYDKTVTQDMLINHIEEILA